MTHLCDSVPVRPGPDSREELPRAGSRSLCALPTHGPRGPTPRRLRPGPQHGTGTPTRNWTGTSTRTRMLRPGSQHRTGTPTWNQSQNRIRTWIPTRNRTRTPTGTGARANLALHVPPHPAPPPAQPHSQGRPPPAPWHHRQGPLWGARWAALSQGTGDPTSRRPHARSPTPRNRRVTSLQDPHLTPGPDLTPHP